MKTSRASLRTLPTLLPVIVGMIAAGCSRQEDISFYVLVKSSNYAQDAEGRLTLLNYHFFSEIFLRPDGSVISASVGPAGRPGAAMAYEPREGSHYMEGGHYASVEEVDAAHPNGSYVFDIEARSVDLRGVELRLGGDGGATDIPDPITISLWQDGLRVSPVAVDPEREVVVRWTAYSNGAADPRGIVDDMIFFVVADCRGDRIFHTGLPFRGDYVTFRAREVRIEPGTLGAGQPYSAFVEFPHVVDSRVDRGVPGFTSFATATYLDLRTTGPASDQACPEVPPAMDTGQTDR